MYPFSHTLIPATLLEKQARFVAIVDIQGQRERCFLPPPVSIGDFLLSNIPCLVEKNPPGRKTAYTVRAISVDEGASWIGIDLNLSNRLVEHFAAAGDLRPLVGDYAHLRREVDLGESRIDFKIDNLWVETKTPVDTLHTEYAPSIVLRHEGVREPLNAGRLEQQVRDMLKAMEKGDQAAILTVHQYLPTTRRPERQPAPGNNIRSVLAHAYEQGLQSWELNLSISPEGITFHDLQEKRIEQ